MTDTQSIWLTKRDVRDNTVTYLWRFFLDLQLQCNAAVSHIHGGMQQSILVLNIEKFVKLANLSRTKKKSGKSACPVPSYIVKHQAAKLKLSPNVLYKGQMTANSKIHVCHSHNLSRNYGTGSVYHERIFVKKPYGTSENRWRGPLAGSMSFNSIWRSVKATDPTLHNNHKHQVFKSPPKLYIHNRDACFVLESTKLEIALSNSTRTIAFQIPKTTDRWSSITGGWFLS